MARKGRIDRVSLVMALVLPVALFGLIWLPVVQHFYVGTAEPTPEQVEALRTMPSDARMNDVLLQAELLPSTAQSSAKILERAAEFAGSWSDDHASRLRNLNYARFEVPDALLKAFKVGGDVSLLKEAGSFIASFSRYERSQWRDQGFLRNDHAIASRVRVLVAFWGAYRKSPVYDEAIAREALWHVARCIEFLARPDHFTVWTNHGVMQNLALLQATVAFPMLVDAKALSQLAADRLALQYEFLVNNEGIVLEHSAGYHGHGIYMLELAIGLTELNGLRVPNEWPVKLAAGTDFFSDILRPDGSLPLVGDTVLAKRHTPSDPNAELSGTRLNLYPVAGYGVWHHSTAQRRIHGTAAWTYVPGLGHKHADEMSVLTWQNDQVLITNSGYWPYSDSRRSDVEGWRGSNAPHWRGESAVPGRRSELRAYGQAADLIALVLRRLDGSGGEIVRQIVSTADGKMAVIDYGRRTEPDSQLDVVWTFDPSLHIERIAADRFEIWNDSQSVMQINLAVSSGGSVSTAIGSDQPFAGWVSAGLPGPIMPAPALMASSQGGEPHAMVVFDTQTLSVDEVQFEFVSPDAWRIQGDGWGMRREQQQLFWSTNGAAENALTLSAGPNIKQTHADIVAAVEAAGKKFPHYRDLNFYRMRLSLAVLLGMFLHFAGIGLMGRWIDRVGLRTVSQGLGAAAWLIAGYWGLCIYLV